MSTTAAGAGPRTSRGAAPADVGDGETQRSEARPESFAPDRPYRISGSVSVRPESFGALVYDFTTRRLSFLKTRLLVAVVTGLADHDDVHGALDAAEVPPAQREQYLKALAGLARAGTIQQRVSEGAQPA